MSIFPVPNLSIKGPIFRPGHTYTEKERTAACKAEQIYKMKTIFTQKDNIGPFWVKIGFFVNFLNFSSNSFFFSLRKITWLNSQQQQQTAADVVDPIYLMCKAWYSRFRGSSLIFYELPFFVYFLAPKVSYGREGKLKSEKNLKVQKDLAVCSSKHTIGKKLKKARALS